MTEYSTQKFWGVNYGNLLIGALGRFIPGLSAPLLPIIQQTIRKSGPITIEKYMELALQHPEFGYYRQGNPLRDGGDFTTAPEISQMFGEMIGLWCLGVWEKLGRPSSFILLELGPGLGTMLGDILSVTKSNDAFQQALKIRLLESNQTLRAKQQSKLQKFSPVHIENLDQLEALPLIVVANEFFDNLPLNQFRKIKGQWHQCLVGLDRHHNLTIVEEVLSGDAIRNLGSDLENEVPEGGFREISHASREIIGQLSRHMAKSGGAAIIIDYGYAEPTGENSLVGWKNQHKADIFDRPGCVDITADVDFAALRKCALKHEVKVVGPISQSEFLRQSGIRERAASLCDLAAGSKTDKINMALEKLLSPLNMGELWKVLFIESHAPNSKLINPCLNSEI